MAEIICDKILADIVRLGANGPQIHSGDTPPNDLGFDAPLGSFYICRQDGSWWNKGGPSPFGWVRSLSYISVPNGDSVTLTPGMPVAIVGGMLYRATASSYSLAAVAGLVAVGAGITLPVRLLPIGLLTLDVSSWTTITGESGGLTPGAIYYLGLTLGTLTTISPSNAGQFVVEVGQSIDATSLLIARRTTVLL